MNRLLKFLKPVCCFSMAATTAVFSFVPECVFTHGFIYVDYSQECIVICNRIICLIVITLLCMLFYYAYLKLRKKKLISGSNYKIVVEYGDIFKKKNCKKVIAFDECFTTTVGQQPQDIKPDSICGQFLARYANINIQALINQVGLKPHRKGSAYKGNVCYESGSIVPFNDFLLLAFAKLDSEGNGRMTREEFLDCLELLWKEINKYYAYQSVAIPILGSGITRLKGEPLTKQQLLDMIIASYKLYAEKIKLPAKLYIECKRDDYFSLNKIGEYI